MNSWDILSLLEDTCCLHGLLSSLRLLIVESTFVTAAFDGRGGVLSGRFQFFTGYVSRKLVCLGVQRSTRIHNPRPHTTICPCSSGAPESTHGRWHARTHSTTIIQVERRASFSETAAHERQSPKAWERYRRSRFMRFVRTFPWLALCVCVNRSTGPPFCHCGYQERLPSITPLEYKRVSSNLLNLLLHDCASFPFPLISLLHCTPDGVHPIASFSWPCLGCLDGCSQAESTLTGPVRHNN